MLVAVVTVAAAEVVASICDTVTKNIERVRREAKEAARREEEERVRREAEEAARREEEARVRREDKKEKGKEEEKEEGNAEGNREIPKFTDSKRQEIDTVVRRVCSSIGKVLRA